jgi:hypothetical protein
MRKAGDLETAFGSGIGSLLEEVDARGFEDKPEKPLSCSKTRLYGAYGNFMRACLNPGNKDYKYYGAKGIGVCSEWASSFKAFEAWAKSSGYTSSARLTRKDKDKGYSPGNCAWKARRPTAPRVRGFADRI